MIGDFEAALRARRDAGGKCLVPYVTGGLGDDWIETLGAVAAAGADAIEIGVPFSDPVMDGPTIQAANDLALEQGATPQSILDAVRRADIGVPTAVMTYGNIAFRIGWERFAHSLADAGVSGCILPDVPLEEIGPWTEAADAAGVETILLAAPTGSDERLARVCERSHGFVYGVGLLGITGVRTELAASAKVIARRLKAITGLSAWASEHLSRLWRSPRCLMVSLLVPPLCNACSTTQGPRVLLSLSATSGLLSTRAEQLSRCLHGPQRVFVAYD